MNIFLWLQYDAARYMYIQVEHPKIIVRGEQIGVRVTVFNYWYDDDYLEVSTIIMVVFVVHIIISPCC